MIKNVSIIVPVYNVEKYLARCIDSVLAQTSSEWELLLINDGSTDNSGKICDRYAKLDPRIRVFNKSNGGVSSARNLGIDNANGSYLTFLDSDDSLEPNTISHLLELVKKYTQVDLIDFPVYHYGESPNKDRKVCVDKLQSIDNEDEKTQYWYYNPRFESCGRLYRRSLLGALRFNMDLRVGEDTVFFLNYYLKCCICLATPEGQYNYFYRKESVMNSQSQSNILESDVLMLNALEDTSLTNHPLYVALLYRVIIPKLRDKTISLGQLETYKKYISPIKFIRIIKSRLPFKAIIALGLIKLLLFFK